MLAAAVLPSPRPITITAPMPVIVPSMAVQHSATADFCADIAVYASNPHIADNRLVLSTPASSQGRATATPAPPLRELRGVVERITYQNPENGYTVARLAPERASEEAQAARDDERLVTLVGTLADLTAGEAIVAQGWWRNDAKHGWQFQAQDYRTTLPATLQGMKRYLGSGLVKGIGPVMAGRIVDTFGEETFRLIDADAQRLTRWPGSGPCGRPASPRPGPSSATSAR